MAVTAALTGILVTTTAATIDSQNKARRVQKEANAVGTASQLTADRNALKQKQREQRIRAAQIQQSASNTGVSASSGEIGALGGLQTMYSGLVSQVQGQQNAANAMTDLNNTAARYNSQASTYSALGNLALSGYSAYNQVQTAK